MRADRRPEDYTPGHHVPSHFDESPTAFDEALAPHADFLHKAEVYTLRFVLYIVFIVIIMFVLTHAMGCNKCGGKASDDKKKSSDADTKKCSPNCTLLNSISNALNKGVNWFMQYGLLFMLGLSVMAKLPTTTDLINMWSGTKSRADQEVDGIGADTVEKEEALGEEAYENAREKLEEQNPDADEEELDDMNAFDKFKPEEEG